MALVANWLWHWSTLAKFRRVPVIWTRIMALRYEEQSNSRILLIVSESSVTILLLTDSI